MIPISKFELERFGRGAASRIPAIWAGPHAPKGPIEVMMHQADVIDAIDWLTADEFCGVRNRPIVLVSDERNHSDRCVFHARGDNRDRVDVFCPNGGEGTIRLAGDATFIESANRLGTEEQEQILAWLKRYRVNADRHHATSQRSR